MYNGIHIGFFILILCWYIYHLFSKDNITYISDKWRKKFGKTSIVYKRITCKKEGTFSDKDLNECIISFNVYQKSSIKHISEYRDKTLIENLKKSIKSNFKNLNLDNFSIITNISLAFIPYNMCDTVQVIITLGEKESYSSLYNSRNNILYPVDPLSSYDLFRILSQNANFVISFIPFTNNKAYNNDKDYDDIISFAVDNSDNKELLSFLKKIQS